MITKQTWKIGDCLELMKELEDNSVDLVLTDPPYYKVNKADWDKQWETFDEYLNWLESIAIEIKRILKPNGSLYVFGDDHRIAYIQVRLDKHFSFLNHLVWYKRNNQSIKGAMSSRRYVCISERILFYEQKSENGLPATGLQAIHSDKGCFAPIKEYMTSEYNKTGLSYSEINELLGVSTNGGGMAAHFFSIGNKIWMLPVKRLYEKLQTTGRFQRNYEDLRQDYEDLRRVFNPYKNMYEVFDIPIISGAENTSHPTTKPVELIERMIKISSNEGDLICDPFLGSGTTLEACRRTNRNCIGFEIDPQWESLYPERCKSHIPHIESFFTEE